MTKRFFSSYQPPAVSVASALAKEIDWIPTLNAVGDFVAINGVDISSESSGNVATIDFDSGQFVDKDQALITIDDSIDQAVLKFNQSDLTLKTLNFKRQSDLFKRNAAAMSTVDEAKATMEQAQAKIEQIHAQIDEKHIKAPFAGQLGIRQVNLGQFITPGQTIIVSLQSLDPLYLQFYLPEQLYKKIAPGQTITFSVEQFPNFLFEAKVSAINSKVDMNTHNIQVQGILANCPAEDMDNPSNSKLIKTRPESGGGKIIITCNTDLNTAIKVRKYTFLPGMYAAIEIDQKIKPHTIIVPSTAISYSLYGNSIYLIEKNKEHPELLTVRRVFVSTGEQRGNFTVIKKGIKAGQLIVSAGDMKLQNGTSVVINNEVQLNESSNFDLLGQ
jgi:membrane fusion protein (multidrug efflux system)